MEALVATINIGDEIYFVAKGKISDEKKYILQLYPDKYAAKNIEARIHDI